MQIWIKLLSNEIGNHIKKGLFSNFGIGELFEKMLPKEEDFSKALYTFDIGQNDLTAGYKLNLSTEQVKAYVPDVLNQLSIVIKVIHLKTISVFSFFLFW